MKHPGCARLPLGWLLVAAVAVGCSSPERGVGGGSDSAPAPRVRVLETGPLAIDRIYHSMVGPYDRFPVDLSGLDWVTSFSTEVVDAESGEPLGDEFFCHSQLQLLRVSNATRLVVTATGSEEIRFPPGYGMPVGQILGGLPEPAREVTFLGMVLNNHQPEIDRSARVRATLEYWTDDDLRAGSRSMRALYKVGLPMTVEDLEAYAPEPGESVNEDVTTHCVLVDEQKSHWIVPPGTQRTRKRYDNIVPVEATVHYASVHLHNHGVYLSLTDVTTGERLWRTDVVYEPHRRQIAEIPAYSSAEGFRVYPDHEYEIEAFYDNVSGADVDAMAQVDLYYHPVGGERITYSAGRGPA